MGPVSVFQLKILVRAITHTYKMQLFREVVYTSIAGSRPCNEQGVAIACSICRGLQAGILPRELGLLLTVITVALVCAAILKAQIPMSRFFFMMI
ncbi:MAG: hypothetical protein H6602_03190 [Flavobacteriales bacterium]|nr:hypothetical protein [Flavobacteriales bacterium]